MTLRSEKIAKHHSESNSESSEVIWVKCTHQVAVPTGLEEALKTAGYDVHCGREASAKDVPSSIIYCPNEEEVGSEVRLLRALSENARILVLHEGADSQFVLAALQVGAHGFVGVRPTQVISALSAASKDGVLVARELLERLLVERTSRESYLTPHQREILFELAVTVAMTSGGEILLPKKLFEGFLTEVMLT